MRVSDMVKIHTRPQTRLGSASRADLVVAVKAELVLPPKVIDLLVDLVLLGHLVACLEGRLVDLPGRINKRCSVQEWR